MLLASPHVGCTTHLHEHLHHLLQGHCRDCKYKLVKCPNLGCSELMPAEMLDRHVDVDCLFRMVVCNHCREEMAANRLEVRSIHQELQ